MLSLILTTIISAQNPMTCGFGAVCSTDYGAGGRATATINITLTLTSAQQMSMNSETLDKDLGAYRLAVNTISTGSADARMESVKFLILDSTPQETGIQLALMDGHFSYSRSEDSDAIVMEWSEENERLVMEMIEEFKLVKEMVAKKSQYRLHYSMN